MRVGAAGCWSQQDASGEQTHRTTAQVSCASGILISFLTVVRCDVEC